MRRVVVLGGQGFFGGLLVERLRSDGLRPLVAARRRGADLSLDAEEPASLRRALRSGDVVVDAAGPFQGRTTALLEAAIELGFDAIDISDSLEYAEKALALEGRIQAAGIRILTSCSSVSAVTAALIRLSGVVEPVRVAVFLAPATRHTARRGGARSLIASVGRPVRVLRGGRIETVLGWAECRRARLPPPLGNVMGRLMESADSVLLPRSWPSLSDAGFYVYPNSPGLSFILGLAIHRPFLRSVLERLAPAGLVLSRLLGSSAGCFAVEVEDSKGKVVRQAFVSRSRRHNTAIAPAALAARGIAEGKFERRGLVLPDGHVEPARLLEYLKALGIEYHGV